MTDKHRCSWSQDQSENYVKYHDEEWGVPVHDDFKLFEFLLLEGAQAGLSWNTILAKREGYRQSFAEFDFNKVAAFDDEKLLSLFQSAPIVRNRLKINAARQNAIMFIKVREQFGSFDHYLWAFVNHAPIHNKWKSTSEVPASTQVSELLSKDLKRRGFKFVGPTIMYAFMQAVGMVNDHTTNCYRHQELIVGGQ